MDMFPQTVKNLTALQETWVQSLGPEDALEKGMATHSSILAQKIPWTEESGELKTMGSQRVGHNRQLTLSLSTFPEHWFSIEVIHLGAGLNSLVIELVTICNLLCTILM